jgi:serine/threonine protein kinase
VSEHPQGDDGALPSSAAARVDAVCDRFEDAWLSGQRPRIEDALGDAPQPERAELLRQLLRVELFYRRRDGERPVPDEYCCRFPQHAELIRGVFAEPEPCGFREMPIPSAAGQHAPGVDSQPTGPNAPAAAAALDPSGPAAAGQFPDIPGHEVFSVLGVGGMGIVYRARNKQLDRLVALKMITTGGAASPEQRARFLTEAQAVARLHHANIVQIYAIGEHNGQPYFSLELCEGGSLAAKLRGGPLPPREAAQLVETLAGAMQAAHERGIIHRDLKPANVLLTAGGRPKIGDFGLAKMVDAPAGWTASGAILGTPSYMAPEQAGGKTTEIGPAADVYALGAILYECLTGRPPFRAATPLDTVLQVLSQEPLPVRFFQRKLPRDLETVCLKCLEKDPARRYSTAAALAEDLHRFLAGEPIQARPMTLLEEIDLMMKDKQIVVMFNVIFAGLVGILALVYLTPNLVNCFSVGNPRDHELDFFPGRLLAPRLFGFGATLIGFMRPNWRNIVIGSIAAAGAVLVTLGAGVSAVDVATSFGVGAGIAVCLGTAGRFVARYSGRTILETLPGLILGGLVGGLMLAPGGFAQAADWVLGHHVSQSLRFELYGSGSRGVTSGQLFFALFLGGGFIGAILGGMALGAFHTWRDRGRLRRREGAALMSKPLPRPLPPPLPTREAQALPAPPATAPYLPAETTEGRSLLPLSLPPPSVVALPDDAPAVPGYELLGLLGRGGMGVVYQARHVQLRRVVALKVIRSYGPSEDDARERFQIEARSAARLHHPNIVQVYEVGEVDGQPYAALEYVAGGSLAHQLAGRPLPAQQAAQLLETLARAVDIAHHNGIIHRDLKPANVLLTPDGQPKIADFGLAKLVDEQAGLTPTDAVVGTPSYMAPEQASGQVHKVGPAADIYALGATLYELLTGRPPFLAATALETLKQVCLKEPMPPHRLVPSVPRTLEAVCLKCLSKEPRQRYASASELADDLCRFRHGQPTRARPPALWERWLVPLWRALWKRWLISLLPVALLGLLVAIFGVMGRDMLAYCSLTALFIVLLNDYYWKCFRRSREKQLVEARISRDDFPFVPITRCSDGWIIVQLSRLWFPSICSDCGAPTGNTRVTWRFAQVLDLSIPFCRACGTRFRRRRQIGTFVVVSLVEAILLALLCLLTGGGVPFKLVLIGQFWLNVLFLPLFIVFVYALATRTVLPVKVRRYSALDGTIEVRFRRTEYAERFVAWTRAWEKRLQQSKAHQ